MSSWDRSRRIPWSRLEQLPPGEGLNAIETPDAQRERILRSLARERALIEQEEARLTKEAKKARGAGERREEGEVADGRDTADYSSDGDGLSQGKQDTSSEGGGDGQLRQRQQLLAHPFSTGELLRQVAFGTCMGSITGAVFGFMDGMRQAADSTVLKRASTQAKGRFLLQGTTRTGLTFGAFFGGFHAVKYGVKVLADPGDYAEWAAAGVISMGVMTARPSTRPSLPYAGMLVLMDAFHLYMRDA